MLTFKERLTDMRRRYGVPFLVHWTGTWAVTGVGIYAGIEAGGFDCVALVGAADGHLGTSLAASLDPRLGNVAIAAATNEARSPFGFIRICDRSDDHSWRNETKSRRVIASGVS